MPAKKRHHYVPQAYLRSFCDASGRLYVYRKEAPDRPLHVAPSNAAFRRYYYSQPKPDGGVDNDRLEDIFSTVESGWTPLLKRMRRKENVNDALTYLFEFIALQRVRIPASRDVTEARLAAQVKEVFEQLRTQGRLPPPPPQLDLDAIEVAIDPHQSIHGMVSDIMREVMTVFERLGLFVIHNQTAVRFVSSDNPVVWFDPDTEPESEKPYHVQPDGRVLLLFPLTPTMLLMGDSSRKADFSERGLFYGEVPDEAWAKRVNEQICRYAYEAVIASTPGHEALVERYAAQSPVTNSSDPQGPLIFGQRRRPPKWAPRS